MDAEIKAMSDVTTALSELQPEAVQRVLKWAAQRFEVEIGRVAPTRADRAEEEGVEGKREVADGQHFTDFHDLFDAANPTTGPDKALVVGYWFQVVQGEADLDSFQLNKELRNLGHPSTNITRDLDSLINRSPRFVIQTRKEGSSKQARKKYKLTREGIKAVERMLGEGGSAPGEG